MWAQGPFGVSIARPGHGAAAASTPWRQATAAVLPYCGQLPRWSGSGPLLVFLRSEAQMGQPDCPRKTQHCWVCLDERSCVGLRVVPASEGRVKLLLEELNKEAAWRGSLQGPSV